MQKIPTMFERDWDGDRSRVLDQIHEGCEWVLAGEGTPTRKYDGTCLMWDGSTWWARREVKEGKEAPAGFQALSHDSETGKTIGWEPAEQSSFAKFWKEAAADYEFDVGTYELVGPKVQKNPEGFSSHVLIAHDDAEVLDVPDRSFDGIRSVLEALDVEGIVFHHPDGRRAKIKKRDFGLKR